MFTRIYKTLTQHKSNIKSNLLHNTMFNWVWDFLFRWGLWNKKANILFLGLDNAGKTTLLHLLKTNRIAELAPTLHSSHDELKIGNLTFTAFDIGGHIQARRCWKNFYCNVDAIVYMIDAHDKERFAESKLELDALFMIDELREKPFLILGNKTDAQGAVSEDDLRYRFNLTGFSRTRGYSERPLEVFMCSVLCRQGYGDGLMWLSQQI